MKKLITLVMAVVLILTGCAAGGNSEAALSMTLTDKFGNEIAIDNVPETVISMSPEITEIIFAIGGNEKLIGRSSYCDFPAETADVVDYGSLFDLNVESIVEAAPDVIFLSSMASEELAANLMEQGLTVVTIDKDSSLEGTYDYINLVGQIFDMEDAASELVEGIKTQISDVESKVEGLDKPTVYHVVYADETYNSGATGDTFIHDMIGSAGGENVAADGTDWQYTVEKLVEKDPYIVTCSMYWDTKSMIEGLAGYSDLTAVIEGRLMEVDENIFSRQGPRVGDAVEALAKIYHPEAFE